MKYKLAWLALVVSALTAFAIIEYLALWHEDGVSLSQTVVDLLYAWPPLGFLLGLGVGILVTHFGWPWVPKQLKATCGQCQRTILIERNHDHAV